MLYPRQMNRRRWRQTAQRRSNPSIFVWRPRSSVMREHPQRNNPKLSYFVIISVKSVVSQMKIITLWKRHIPANHLINCSINFVYTIIYMLFYILSQRFLSTWNLITGRYMLLQGTQILIHLLQIVIVLQCCSTDCDLTAKRNDIIMSLLLFYGTL